MHYHSKLTTFVRHLFPISAIGVAVGQATQRTANVLTPRFFVFVVGCAAYMALATGWQSRCERSGSRKRLARYFAVMVPLVAVLASLSPVYGPETYLILPLLAQAVFSLSFRGTLLVALALLLVQIFSFGLSCSIDILEKRLWEILGLFLFMASLIWTTLRANKARIRAEQLASKLEAANAQLQQQAKQVEELAKIQERNRIAREIHDGLGHYLTAIGYQTEAAETLIERSPTRAKSAAANARHLAQEALIDVRHSVHALHSETDLPDLCHILHGLAKTNNDVEIALSVNGQAKPMPHLVTHTLVRIAQEGITNIRKHGVPTKSRMELDFAIDGKVCLTISNMLKTNPQPPRPGYGLKGLSERLSLVRGTLQTSCLEDTFILKAEIPL